MKRLGLLAALVVTACIGADAPKAEPEPDDGHAGVVRVSPAAMERVGIRVSSVDEGQLEAHFELPAEVMVHPDLVALVSTHVDGHVDELMAAEGDQVEQGATLARLHSVTVGSARSELKRVRATLRAAESNLERKRALLESGATPLRAVEVAEAEVAGARANERAAADRVRLYAARGRGLSDAIVEAPISGYVVSRDVTRGEILETHDRLFVLADLGRVRVEARVYERDLARVEPGQRVELSLVSTPDRVWPGTIDRIGRTLDAHSRTAKVVVDFDNPDGVLRPGSTGVLRVVESPERHSPTAYVPLDAVQHIDGRDYVFVGEGEGEFVPTEVQLGFETDEHVVIVEGVGPGTQVAISGTFALRSELLRNRLSG